MLSLRYLRPRRRQGFVSVIAGFSLLGIMLGVATLIIVMAVMNGFREELLGKILGVNGHFIAQGVSRDISNYDDVTESLRAIDGVTQAIPFVEGQVMASSAANASGVLVRGLTEDNMLRLTQVSDNLQSGTLEGFDDAHGVAIGTRLALKHRVAVGDNLTLISPRGPVTPFGITPRIQPFQVVAIFEVGMSEYDTSLVFMSLGDAQPYFNFENTVSSIEIKVEDPDDIDRFWAPIAAELGDGTRLTSWQQLNATFFNALQVERNVMFLILTLIVLVAALNIISGLIMLVKDKGRDIAILRTMGATRGAVMRVFFITGASIGFVGTMAGFVIGLLFCANIETIRQFISKLTGTEVFSPELYFLSQLPAKVEPTEVVTVVLMSLALSFAATLYPSWSAARLDPVDALRYE
jgi:lipoprotein-releasing system permease protein